MNRLVNYLYSGDYDDKLTPTLQWESSSEDDGVSDLTSEEEAEFTDGEDTDLVSEDGTDPAGKKAIECCAKTDDTLDPSAKGTGTEGRLPTSKIESVTSPPELQTSSSCTTLNSQLPKAEAVPFSMRRSSRIKKKHDTESKAIAEENSCLKANAFVFMLADYYQLPGLKDLAAKKFAIALTNFNIDGFSEVLSLIYGSEYLAMAQELRRGATAIVIQHLQSLVKDKAFSDECLRQPEILVDALPGLATKQQQDAISASELRASLTQQTDLVKTLNNDLSVMKTNFSTRLAGVKRVYTQMNPNKCCCNVCGFYPPNYGAKWCSNCRNDTVEKIPVWPTDI